MEKTAVEVSSERKYLAEFKLPLVIRVLCILSKKLEAWFEKRLAAYVKEYERAYIKRERLNRQIEAISEQLEMLKNGIDMDAFWGLPNRFNPENVVIPKHPRILKCCNDRTKKYLAQSESILIAKEDLKSFFKIKNSDRILAKIENDFNEGATKVILCELKNAKKLVKRELKSDYSPNETMKIDKMGLVLSRDSSQQEREIVSSYVSAYKLLSLAMIPLP